MTSVATSSALHLSCTAVLGHSCSFSSLASPSTSTSAAVAQRFRSHPGVVTIRCAKSGEPLRRPSLNAPPASPSTQTIPPESPPQQHPQESSSSSSAPPASDTPAAAPAPPPGAGAAASAPTAPPPPPPPPKASVSSGVTIEYQRQRAKEMQEFFLDRKYENDIYKSRIFGWTRKNEITNGRWVMFGLAVGLLTEYATGADFVEQLRIIVNNLGILDID